jgi:Transposase DDE domain
MAVAHDVESGLAVRPSWGAACGTQATSEQKLVEEVLERLPSGAVVLGDRNFGIFSVAWVAQQHHPVLFRLTNARAGKLLGRALEPGIDDAVVWRPSHDDRRAHSELPAGIQLAGRVIVCELKGTREPLLCLFTTLDKPASEIIQMYGLRWNIETDLRALKRTVRLHHVHARSVEMMEKDLLLAVLAYNLVRTVMCLAARKAGLSPRQLSFTSVYTLVEHHLPTLLRARSHQNWRHQMDILVDYAAAYKLPRRRKPRSYPRAVWGTGYRFASRSHEKTK